MGVAFKLAWRFATAWCNSQRVSECLQKMLLEMLLETVPDVISGIELTANGRKVAWSIADYLASLEKSVGELLREQSNRQTRPEAKAEGGPETPEHETAHP